MEGFDIFQILPPRGPIPAEFHRECGDGPFERCDACGHFLADLRGYSLIKEFQGERCIFEFALCFDCAVELCTRISEESATRLAELVPKSSESCWISEGDLPEDEPPEDESPEEACLFCGRDRTTAERYSVRIRCRGSEWIDGPEIFCGSCEKRIDSMLSPRTRGEFEDWFRENVPGIPGSEIDIETLISKL